MSYPLEEGKISINVDEGGKAEERASGHIGKHSLSFLVFRTRRQKVTMEGNLAQT